MLKSSGRGVDEVEGGEVRMETGMATATSLGLTVGSRAKNVQRQYELSTDALRAKSSGRTHAVCGLANVEVVKEKVVRRSRV